MDVDNRLDRLETLAHELLKEIRALRAEVSSEEKRSFDPDSMGVTDQLKTFLPDKKGQD